MPSLAGKVAVALAATWFMGAAQAQPLTECRVAGIRNSVQCGVVKRLLDPARPQGPTVDIRYVVVPAMARRKLPDPVFLLAGGPGQSAIGVAPQVMALAAQCTAGAYFGKYVIVVDEDVDPTNVNQVLWAMATRSRPAQSIDILRETWSTYLDPSLNPPEIIKPWRRRRMSTGRRSSGSTVPASFPS